ncbi:MAG: putative transporter, permease component [Gemmatimonadetes bacterium]|nr:putative transporter, permease component [Gemmatimonadota bacterium]
MKTVALAFRYLWSRPLQALLNLLMLTLGLASITFVLLASEQIDRAFQRDLAGIDLVVGAKGSPMQLILAGVFHIDVPPGNISLQDAQELRKHPQVAQLIPLSMGDTFRGFRIVGTTVDYLEHYKMAFAQGQAWVRPMEAVLGAQVARSTGMVLGDTFVGSHGLGGGGGHDHGENLYRIKGVLAPCGCVADRLILTATESVWQVHEKAPMPVAAPMPDAAGDTHEAHAAQEPPREITMALITYKSPLAAATLPRWVNSSTRMQAAAPALEVSRLLRLLGVGSEVLRGVGAVLLFTAALSVFIALWNAVRERREDLAMLRMLGATPTKVAALLLSEALWLALLASVLGLAAGHGLTALVGYMLEAQHSLPISGRIWVPAEAWIPVAAVGVATLAALIPSVTAYRIDVAQLLNAR